MVVNKEFLLNKKYLLIQKGKKNYYPDKSKLEDFKFGHGTEVYIRSAAMIETSSKVEGLLCRQAEIPYHLPHIIFYRICI